MNLGALKLREAIAVERGRQQAIADAVGVHPGVVTRWAWTGRDGRGAKPNTQNRLRLSSLLGIGISDWDEPAEDQREEPAA